MTCGRLENLMPVQHAHTHRVTLFMCEGLATWSCLVPRSDAQVRSAGMLGETL